MNSNKVPTNVATIDPAQPTLLDKLNIKTFWPPASALRAARRCRLAFRPNVQLTAAGPRMQRNLCDRKRPIAVNAAQPNVRKAQPNLLRQPVSISS